DHLVQLLCRPVRRGLVRLHHDRQPRESRRGTRPHRDALDGKVAPPEHSEGAVQGDQLVLQQHRERVAAAHAGTSGAGSPSIGSESDAPGGIIGKTFASCSMTNSTSAGPGTSIAARTASAVPSASATRQPGTPYAS